MNYPYITLYLEYKNQIIIEGCCNTKNFKVLIKDDKLFDEPKVEYQYPPKNDKIKLMSFFDLLNKKSISSDLVFEIYLNLYNL